MENERDEMFMPLNSCFTLHPKMALEKLGIYSIQA
jgi:hypothetical protein